MFQKVAYVGIGRPGREIGWPGKELRMPGRKLGNLERRQL